MTTESAEPAPTTTAPPSRRAFPTDIVLRAVAMTGEAGLFLLAVVEAATGWVSNESRSRGIDAMTMLETGLRLRRFGGSYYTTGADHKGPLFQAVYDLAARLGGRDYGWWYVSALIAVVGAVTAWSLARIVCSLGASPLLGTGIGVAVFGYLTLARTGFSGILYARNLTAALVSVVMAEVVTARAPRPMWRWGLAGVLGGIAAQTILTELGSVLVAGAALWWLAAHWQIRPEAPARGLARAARAVPPEVRRYVGGVAVALIAPFGWYAARGLLGEYTYWWWTYSGYYADSTGRSAGEVVRVGLEQFRHLYATQPWQLLTLALFFTLLFAAAIRPGPGRRHFVFTGLVLTGWWIGGCASVAAAQRYSLPHFVVSTVPVAGMAAVVVHRLLSPALADLPETVDGPSPTAERLPGRATHMTAALLLALAVLIATGWPESREGWRQLAHFTSFRARAATNRRNVGGEVQTIRAITAFFTPPGDGAWAWSTQPYWVSYFDRVAGSRYIESRILNGYIYLGAERASFVPHDAWAHWAADLERSRTAIVADTDDYALPDLAAARDYLRRHFTPAAEVDRWNLWVRTSRLAAVAPRSTTRMVSFGTSGAVAIATDRSCVEVRPAGTVSVRVRPPSGTGETDAVVVDATTVRAEVGDEGASQTRHTAPRPPGPVRVLVGRRAIVVLAGDRVVTAIVRPAGADAVTLSAGPAGVASSGEVANVLDCWGFA